MFSGIVGVVGKVVGARAREGDGEEARRIVVEAGAAFVAGVRLGDSVAVDGVCLTVVDRGEDLLSFDAVETTLERTTLGGFREGRRVNLELALAVGDRIGGHIVQGHVDGTGRVEAVERQGDQVVMEVSLPETAAEVAVPRGSLAINGVSLTVSDVPARGRARVTLIPYTWEHTNLSDLIVGSAVNIEGDMLGRFVVHYLKLRDG